MFNFFKKQSVEIYAPLDGEIHPLSASPDEAFGQGMMGEGLCINPTGDTIYAPFDCTINIFHTLHAVGCKNSSIEVIVHIGMDTVQLNGEGFKALSPMESKVKNQTPLISFDATALNGKVETLMTPIVIVDKPETATIEIIKDSGMVKAGDLIMKINL